jgi:hypothetical protein
MPDPPTSCSQMANFMTFPRTAKTQVSGNDIVIGTDTVCLLRGGARRDPAEPGDDAVYVSVNGERGPSHREREHARGRLQADAWQRCQVTFGRLIAEVMQAAEVNAALAFVDFVEDLLDAVRFLAGEAAAADRVLNLPGGCVRRLLPGGEPRLEPGERPAGVHVGGVL